MFVQNMTKSSTSTRIRLLLGSRNREVLIREFLFDNWLNSKRIKESIEEVLGVLGFLRMDLVPDDIPPENPEEKIQREVRAILAQCATI